jgi:hypothetical protein
MPDIQEILSTIKYGSQEDKIEAITKARGRANEMLLQAVLGQERAKGLMKMSYSGSNFTLDNHEQIRAALWEILESKKDILVCWYATITLVDLGDISQSCLEILVQASEQVISWLVETGKREGGTISGAITEWQVQEETIRALSKFSANIDVSAILKECFEGGFLKGLQHEGRFQECALYAFATSGNPELRPLVEYHAKKATDNTVKKAAKVSLELWGRANYDEIAARARATEKGFFRRLFG